MVVWMSSLLPASSSLLEGLDVAIFLRGFLGNTFLLYFANCFSCVAKLNWLLFAFFGLAVKSNHNNIITVEYNGYTMVMNKVPFFFLFDFGLQSSISSSS